MIIGLEHICFWSLMFALLFALAALILRPKCLPILIGLAVVLLSNSVGMYAALDSAQANVEKHYIDYIKLQVQVAKYDDLDIFEQYEVRDDVMTYNLWYEKNKSDLENEWSFKGTSDYAKEFDYIVIGG